MSRFGQTASAGPAVLRQTQAMNADYQQVMQPPVSNLMGNAFAAVQGNPLALRATELVTVSPENGLIWFHHDKKSGSGWVSETCPIYEAPQQNGTPQIPNAMHPFYQGDNLYVFSEYDAPAGSGQASLLRGMERTKENGWGQAQIDPSILSWVQQLTQCGLVLDQDGQGYLYGLSSEIPNYTYLVVLGREPGGKQLTFYMQQAVTTGASYKLLPGPAAGEFVLLGLQGSVATFQAATLSNARITLTGPQVSQDLNLGDLTADTVVPIGSSLSGVPAFLLLAADQQVYLVTGNGLNGGPTPTATQLTGAADQPGLPPQPPSVRSITGGCQPDGSFSAFALDNTDYALWTWTEASPGAGFNWIPLGNAGIAIASPPYMAGSPEVFLCTPSTIVAHLKQRASSASWFTMPVAIPSLQSTPISETSSFTQQFSLISSGGVPMPGQFLSVCADPAQVLVVNDIAYHATPNEPAIVKTDPMGNLSIASCATGLASPILTITGDALQNASAPAPYRGDLQLHQRIAGQGYSYSGSDLIGTVLPAGTSTDTANTLATNLQSISGVAVNIANGASADASFKRQAVQLRFEGKELRSRNLTDEEFQRLIGDSESVLGDAWGDFAHLCKQAWNEIKSITIQLADITANITVELYKTTKSFVLTTIDDIRDALEVLLQWAATLWKDLVDVIKLFIEFIKLLFDWGNILLTQQVVVYAAQQLLDDMQNPDSGAAIWIGNKINALCNDVNSVFGKLEAVFGATTFGGASSGSTSSGIQQQSQTNGVQYNYIMSKSMTPMPALDAPPSGSGYDPASAWSTFTAALDNAFANSEGEIKSSWEQIKTCLENVNSLSDLLDLAIVTVLNATQDVIYLVLQAINAVIDTILSLMAGAAGYISELLQRKIDIPVVTALFSLITEGKETLSLLSLVGLAVAVPATMAYDILHDGAPFTSQQVSAILNSKIQWPWSGDFPADADVQFSALGTSNPAFQGIVAVVAGVCSFFYGFCDLAADTINLGIQDSHEDVKELTKVVSALSLVFNLIATIAGAPWYAPNPSDSPAASMELGTFAAALPPWLVDAFCYAYNRELGRMASVGGPWSSMAFGAVQTGCGVATAVMMTDNAGSYSYSLADKTAGVLSGLSNIGKPFIFLGDWGALCVVCLDLVGDWGSTITDVAADTK